MRLKIKFGPNSTPVDRNIQNIVSWLHNVIGRDNKYHKLKFKPYSVSEMFCGYRNEDGTKDYPKGGFLYFSSDDTELIKLIHKNAWSFPFDGGMQVLNISQSIDEIYLNDEMNFMNTSLNGIFLYKQNGGTYSKEHHPYNEDGWIESLNRQTKRKLAKVAPNVDLSSLKIEFAEDDQSYVVFSKYKEVLMLSSRLNLMVYGTVEVKRLLMTYGLGHLTGSGYGLIYPSEQINEYR